MFANGIDMVEISRIEKSLEINGFKAKIYGKNELEELVSRYKPLQSFAGNFAAKEAFSKALGTGIRGFLPSEVEILHDKMGAPYFKLSGNAKKIADERKLHFALSITHTADYAAAVVTAYTEE